MENKKIYKLDNKIHENQIIFIKDNKIEVKNTPSYGTIKFHYQNNKLTFIETSVTEKYKSQKKKLDTTIKKVVVIIL